MTYAADPDVPDETSSLGVFIKPGAKATGVQTHPEYDYSQLGETGLIQEYLEYQILALGIKYIR